MLQAALFKLESLGKLRYHLYEKPGNSSKKGNVSKYFDRFRDEFDRSSTNMRQNTLFVWRLVC